MEYVVLGMKIRLFVLLIKFTGGYNRTMFGFINKYFLYLRKMILIACVVQTWIVLLMYSRFYRQPDTQHKNIFTSQYQAVSVFLCLFLVEFGWGVGSILAYCEFSAQNKKWEDILYSVYSLQGNLPLGRD